MLRRMIRKILNSRRFRDSRGEYVKVTSTQLRLMYLEYTVYTTVSFNKFRHILKRKLASSGYIIRATHNPFGVTYRIYVKNNNQDAEH